MRVQIPPIKCQGIKSKLVPFLLSHIEWNEQGQWLEPFVGSGVVGFNQRPKRAIFADTNPHIINFYQAINTRQLTPGMVKKFLEQEGQKLAQHGKVYYYEVRTRFNAHQNPLDFLFLTRAGFNGVIRFNSKGKFNVPFNHKPERFSKAYITKVVNQVKAIYKLCQLNEWQFVCQDFCQTLALAQKDDFVYCDPPYMGRHVDYFNGWNEENEVRLFNLLSNCPARFILSTWHSNQHRHNPYIEQYETKFQIVVKEHFYHVGAKEANRKPMLEALVMNYSPTSAPELETATSYKQLRLLEDGERYSIPATH
jgi:DNA adenine methylase